MIKLQTPNSKSQTIFKFKILNLKLSTGILVFGILLVGLYFFTRLYHLTKLPVFCDEAIYIRWAQIMKSEPSLRFLPLQDGKQPLFMWLIMPSLKVFSDPLFAGRMISVMAGLMSLLGVIILPIIVNRAITGGLIGGLFYTLLPFTLFFDRMALVDSLLSAFGIWSLILAILLGQTKRLDVAMVLGILLGGALLTKSPGMFFVGLAPIAAAFQLIVNNEKLKVELRVKSLVKLIGLFLISLVFVFGIYNILRLGPNFHMVGIRNKDYIYSFSEIIKHPFHPFLENIKSAFRYYWHYLTPSILFLGAIGILIEIWKLRTRNWKLLIWWLLPLLAQTSVAKVFTARYILFSIPPFILFASYGLQAILKKLKIKAVVLLIILLPTLFFDWHLWHNPAKASFPEDERAGYLEEWTAGWGIKEIADYLKKLPRDENIIVGTEGFFGTLPDGLQIYLEGENKISVIGVGYPIKTLPEPLFNAKEAGDRVYLVVNRSRLETKDWQGLKLIRTYEKPEGDKLLFFEVL